MMSTTQPIAGLVFAGLVIAALVVMFAVALIIVCSKTAAGDMSAPRRLGVFLVSFTLFATLAFALILRGASRDSGFGPGDGDPPAGGPRTGVEWCVDVPEGREDLVDLVRVEVESVLPEIKSRAATLPGSRAASREPRSIQGVCPGFSSLYGRGETPFLPADDPAAYVEFPRGVSVPGRFSLMIWVLPDDDIEGIFGVSGTRYWTEEVVCSGDDCDSVTGGLYFTADEVRDPKFLRYWMYEYFGLSYYAPADTIPEGFAIDEHCR